MTDQLARRITVSECVRIYQEETDRIRSGFATIDAAEKRLNDTFTMDGWGAIRVNEHGRSLTFDDPESAIANVRKEVWRALVDRLEVRRMMSVSRWEQLSHQLERGEMPDITEENVTALVRGFEQNLGTMLEEAVEEVFNWLRPPRSRLKTNSEYEVPRKVILSHVVEAWGILCSSWRVNYRYDANLTALENVFTALDGKGQITKGHYSAISQVIRGGGFGGGGETEYFRFKTFQNGNIHLEFKRADLLARFNAIAGGKRLRAAPPAEHGMEASP